LLALLVCMDDGGGRRGKPRWEREIKKPDRETRVTPLKIMVRTRLWISPAPQTTPQFVYPEGFEPGSDRDEVWCCIRW